MESPIVGIVVFRLAVGAHPERRHRRGRSVVWDVLNNRVTRTAIGAICEWVEVTAVAWRRRIPKTLSAGCDIRRYQSKLSRRSAAFPNIEAVFIKGFQIGGLDFRNPRQPRRLIPQRGEEFVHCRAFGFDFHAAFVVPHESSDSKPASQIENKWPEAHSLHRATDLNSLSDSRAQIYQLAPEMPFYG